ncbi:MAG: response regulator [Mariniphaga sp.]
MEEFGSLNGLQVLVVNDSQINRVILTNILNRWEILVNTAENGAIAIEKVSKDLYDAVLMDIELPYMQGYEVASTIRAKGGEYFRNLPILALTRMPELEKIEACGMNGYIILTDLERFHKVLSTYLKK